MVTRVAIGCSESDHSGVCPIKVRQKSYDRAGRKCFFWDIRNLQTSIHSTLDFCIATTSFVPSCAYKSACDSFSLHRSRATCRSCTYPLRVKPPNTFTDCILTATRPCCSTTRFLTPPIHTGISLRTSQSTMSSSTTLSASGPRGTPTSATMFWLPASYPL